MQQGTGIGREPQAWVWGAVQLTLAALAGAERHSAKKAAEWTKIEEAILFKWLTPTLAYFESMVQKVGSFLHAYGCQTDWGRWRVEKASSIFASVCKSHMIQSASYRRMVWGSNLAVNSLLH